MVDRVLINDATYGTLLNHVLTTQGPSDALLLGQVRVIQENVNDDKAENLIKCTKENAYVVGWAGLRRRHPADKFSAHERTMLASLFQCIPAMYDISSKQSGSHCRARTPPCPIPCICLDMRLSTQDPGSRDGPTSTPMLQCDVVVHEVDMPAQGQAAAPQRVPGTCGPWNMVRLNRRPVILRSLRDIGAETLYSGFRPHIAGDISFMQPHEALEMQTICRQQADRLHRHCANGMALVHGKAIELLQSWQELQSLEDLAAHCSSLIPPRHSPSQAR